MGRWTGLTIVAILGSVEVLAQCKVELVVGDLVTTKTAAGNALRPDGSESGPRLWGRRLRGRCPHIPSSTTEVPYDGSQTGWETPENSEREGPQAPAVEKIRGPSQEDVPQKSQELRGGHRKVGQRSAGDRGSWPACCSPGQSAGYPGHCPSSHSRAYGSGGGMGDALAQYRGSTFGSILSARGSGCQCQFWSTKECPELRSTLLVCSATATASSAKSVASKRCLSHGAHRGGTSYTTQILGLALCQSSGGPARKATRGDAYAPSTYDGSHRAWWTACRTSYRTPRFPWLHWSFAKSAGSQVRAIPSSVAFVFNAYKIGGECYYGVADTYWTTSRPARAQISPCTYQGSYQASSYKAAECWCTLTGEARAKEGSTQRLCYPALSTATRAQCQHVGHWRSSPTTCQLCRRRQGGPPFGVARVRTAGMSVSPSVCGQKAPPQAVLHLMSFVILWDPMPCEPFLAPWLKLSSGIDTDSDVDWIGMRWCPLVGSNATDSDMSPYRQIVTSAVILQPVVQSALYRCTGSYRCSVVPRCSRSKLVIPGVLWNADLHVCSPSRRQEPPWSMVALCLPLLPCRWSLLPPDLVGAQHFVRAPFAGVSPRTILWVFWCVQKSRIGCSGPATTSIPTTSWGSCGIDLTTTCSHRRPPWLDPWDCDAIHEDVLLVPWRNKPHWYSVAYLPPLSHSLHCHLHMSLSHVSQFHPISPTMRWDLIQFLHGPSSSCVHEEPHHSVLTPTSASNSCARNTCIGRSGTWARSLHTLSFGQVSQSSYDNTQVHLIDGLLSHLVLHLVPFVKGLLGFLFLGLCRLIVRSLPGQHTPLGRSARALTRGAPEKVFRAFAVCSPALCSAARVLNSKATDKMWKPERTARKRCRLPAGGFLSGFILRILALPVLVQSGSEEATVLHHIHDAITASQPDELPSTSVSAVPPEELQVPRNAAVGESSREPLQLMVARCQDESHLEAYGESLDPPMLRICILIPGRQNIILRLPSAEGGAPSVLAQARQQAEHLLEESCDLVPITHQALVGVLTIVCRPEMGKSIPPICSRL